MAEYAILFDILPRTRRWVSGVAMVGGHLKRVVLVGFQGVQALDIVGPMEVFSMANSFSSQARYEIVLASPEGGNLTCSSGMVLAGVAPLKGLPAELDTIIIGGGEEPTLRALQSTWLVDWVRERATRTRRMASVCTGAFVLAGAGLLDNRRATTHWAACEDLKRFRPSIKVEPDAIFVADPPIYTSAGVTSGLDLALSLVEADYGPELALAVARNLVLFMRRPGGQTQFSAGLKAQAAAAPKLQRLIVEIVEQPAQDLRVPDLAARAGMSERTFARTFREETGLTPAAFVEQARVDRAKSILETSDWPLARVAERAGFGSVAALHRVFANKLKTTPGEYRDRFGRRNLRPTAA